MKGLHSSMVDFIEVMGDRVRFLELTSLSLEVAGLKTVVLLQAIGQFCPDLSALLVLSGLSSEADGETVMSELRTLAATCSRLCSVSLGVRMLRLLTDEQWSTVPFAQLTPILDDVEEVNDDDDSSDQDDQPKKRKRAAFIDESSDEDEDQYESDFVVSDGEVSFETDASFSPEPDD